MNDYRMLVPCLLGLEGIVADELRRMGMAEVRAENGRVYFSGPASALARANLGLRCGARVLLVLSEFPARSFEELFQGVRAAPWDELLPQNAAIRMGGYCLDSQLSSAPACRAVAKKAIVEKLKSRYAVERFPEDGPAFPVELEIFHDRVTLALDSSGEGLYKRGYRAVNTGAPLRETLAAALVLLSKYRGRDPFCDPFCGSGTIPIEAALIARNRAPGLDRSFAAQKWGFLPAAVWLDAAEEAMDGEFHGAYDIWGGDLDPAAVAVARSNAEKAGVADTVRFDVADAAKFARAEPYGRVVTNPPYGERLLEHSEAERLYALFGAAARALAPGWRVCVLSSHTEFERAFGRTADKKRKLYNGMLKCDCYMYGKL